MVKSQGAVVDGIGGLNVQIALEGRIGEFCVSEEKCQKVYVLPVRQVKLSRYCH